LPLDPGAAALRACAWLPSPNRFAVAHAS